MDRVKRLEIGLPVEDEFMAVCSWLGHCSLIHKLDQAVAPSASVNSYQVPDIFAEFQVDGVSIPVLIEVKSKKSNTLSMTPKYRSKLLRYGELMGHPVLVAWKWNNLWIGRAKAF